MKLTVIIPTYQRIGKLQNCLTSLANQSIIPDQVIISSRQDDQLTHQLIESFSDRLPIENVIVSIPGVVHAENIALQHATHDIISFIDDDGIAPPHWIESIKKTFEKHHNLSGVGGPDFIFKTPTLRKKVKKVGRISWYGKITGNHHHISNAQYVDTLKGTNMSFLKSHILPLDPILNGDHAEGNGVFWELDFCLNVKQRGKKLYFDPALEIKHDSDHSHFKIYPTIRNGAHNLIYVLFKHHSSFKKIIFFSYYILWGNTQLIGVARLLLGILSGKPIRSMRSFYYSQAGLIRGLKSYYRNK